MLTKGSCDVKVVGEGNPDNGCGVDFERTGGGGGGGTRLLKSFSSLTSWSAEAGR